MGERDRGYRKLFSHPEMVRDLLVGFVKEDWVNEVDLATLERANGSYISDGLREREEDSVWRVRFRDRWLADLVIDSPFGLDRWRPRVSYLLLEERLLATSLDASLRNLAGALFRLEHDRDPRATISVVTALAAWLGAPEQADLRRAFEVMLERVLRPGVETGEAAPTLEEARTMLETNMQRWEHEWHERSEAHGRVDFVLRLVERRFGSVDAAVRARIETASEDELVLFAERVHDSKDVGAVFST